MVASGRELLVKVLAAAEKQLTSADESLIPEFDRFLRNNPDDTNFMIESLPNQGYGTVICMEEACFKEIAMGPHPTYPDAGLARGFGSLINYEEHCRSLEHIASRNTRLGHEVAIKSEPRPNSFRNDASTSSNNFGMSSSAIDSSSCSWDDEDRKPNIDTPPSSKVGSSSFGLPKKRKSDLKPTSSTGEVYNDGSADKKPKLDVEPGVFAERQNAPLAGPSGAGAVGGKPAHIEELERINGKLDRWREARNTLNSLPAHAREVDHFEQLDRANREIQVLTNKEAAWRAVHGALSGQAGAAAAPAAVVPPRPANQPAQLVPGAWPYPANGAAGALAGLGAGTNANAVAGPSNANAGTMAAALAAARARFGGGGGGHDDDMSDDERALWNSVGNVSNEDWDKFVKNAVDSEDFEGNANVDAAAKNLGLKNQKELIPHMTVRLLPHQLIGVAWMQQQETKGSNYGGLVGDEMGLGKTIEAIACCLMNESTDAKEKSTLIIAPLALLEQWKNEIEEKVEDGYWSVVIYHGPERKKLTKKKLQKYDIVLTTYQTIVGEYPNEEGAISKAQKQAKKEGGVMEDYLEVGEKGPLLQIDWFRIILDEAQNIRNKSTQISRACCELESLYRWALTGTPITNSVKDLFPLFRFLQLKPWFEWSHFNERVGRYEKKNPKFAGTRAQVVLRSCMIRRKKDSKLDGQELVKLPKKTIELHELVFTDEEREVYDFVENRAQVKFNKFLKAGTVMKNYAHVLVLITRLRQACLHPCLLADTEQTLAAKKEEKASAKDILRRVTEVVGRDFVLKVKKQRIDLALERIKAERENTEVVDDECPVCMESPDANESGAIVTSCRHVFCRSCAQEFINAPPKDDQDDQGAGKKCKADQRPCPICRGPVGLKELWTLSAFEPTDFELTTATSEDVPMDDDEDETLGGFMVSDDDDKPQPKKKQPNRCVIQDSDDEHSEAEEVPEPSSSDKKGKGKKKEKTASEVKRLNDQEPSTKMLWAYEKLESIWAADPEEKIIIISSFTTALDLMDTFLRSKKIRTCRYQGDMNRSARDESLRILKKSKKCKVMLLSLKAGGVGLTLTRSNRVIALDLAWSPAVEHQAFDRVHRIGQERPVERLTIKNTVEQRILDLQAGKQGMADAAFGEGQGQKLGKLTVADLAGLFGLDPKGRLLPQE